MFLTGDYDNIDLHFIKRMGYNMKKFFLSLLLIAAFTIPLTSSLLNAAELMTESSVSVIFFMPIGNSLDPFIQMCEKGIHVSAALFPGLKIARVYPYSDDYVHEYIKFAAMRGHEYIVGIGSYYADAFEKIADEFPNKNFIVIDGKSTKKNVKSVIFNNTEAGVLAGATAGILTSNNKIGFIGGRETGIIFDFEKGFAEGVKKHNKKAELTVKYISKGNDGYTNQKAGFEIADAMYKNGADIIFAAAGASGLGSIEAARLNKKMIIGVDADQDELARGIVMTSIIKRLDTSIVNLLQSIATAKYDSKETVYNLANVGFALSSFTYSKNKIGKEKLDKIYDELFNLKKKYEYSERSKLKDRSDNDSVKSRRGKYKPGQIFRK